MPERLRGFPAATVLLQRGVQLTADVQAVAVLAGVQECVPTRLQLRLRRRDQHLHMHQRRLRYHLLPVPQHQVSFTLVPLTLYHLRYHLLPLTFVTTCHSHEELNDCQYFLFFTISPLGPWNKKVFGGGGVGLVWYAVFKGERAVDYYRERSKVVRHSLT